MAETTKSAALMSSLCSSTRNSGRNSTGGLAGVGLVAVAVPPGGFTGVGGVSGGWSVPSGVLGIVLYLWGQEPGSSERTLKTLSVYTRSALGRKSVPHRPVLIVT